MTNSNKNIRLAERAERNLAEISSHTHKVWGERQMVKYVNLIKRKFYELRDMPGMGADRSRLGDGLRAHPAGEHVIYYCDSKNELQIICILHKSMDPARYLEPDEDQS